MWGLVFLVLFILALTLPFESFYTFPLFEAYDPLGATPDGIKPEWYFFFVYYPLELMPFWIVGMLVNVALLVVIFSPWIFRGTRRRTLRILASVATLYLVVITVFGHAIYQAFRGGNP
jgi:quinol-cytochrome oxidoreductase complex cytochrome b subunit